MAFFAFTWILKLRSQQFWYQGLHKLHRFLLPRSAWCCFLTSYNRAGAPSKPLGSFKPSLPWLEFQASINACMQSGTGRKKGTSENT